MLRRYMAQFQCRPHWARWLLYPTVLLAWINFVVLVFGSFYLGGDALNGYVSGAHHFLCLHSRSSGRCTEVSQPVWRYSYWQTIVTIVSILIVMMECAVFRVGRKPGPPTANSHS